MVARHCHQEMLPSRGVDRVVHVLHLMSHLQDSERSESGKAAAAAAAGGLAGYLPFFLLTGSSAGLQGLLSLGAAVAGCVLFGVTYRYAVRQDADNLQVGLCDVNTAVQVVRFNCRSPVAACGLLPRKPVRSQLR
jgi:hypothetical protein